MDNGVFSRGLSTLNSTFSHVADHFRAGALKSIMDPIFILIEKIAGKFEVVAEFYLSMYDEMIDQEIQLASVTKEDRILVIGCGAVPATSILIAAKTGAEIIALDHDKTAIEKAKKLINWFDGAKNINLIFADGLTYQVNDFSVIIISYGVKNQQGILSYLQDNCKENTRIVFRTATDIQQLNSKGYINLDAFFIVKDSILSTSFSSIISYLLLPKHAIKKGRRWSNQRINR